VIFLVACIPIRAIYTTILYIRLCCLFSHGIQIANRDRKQSLIIAASFGIAYGIRSHIPSRFQKCCYGLRLDSLNLGLLTISNSAFNDFHTTSKSMNASKNYTKRPQKRQYPIYKIKQG